MNFELVRELQQVTAEVRRLVCIELIQVDEVEKFLRRQFVCLKIDDACFAFAHFAAQHILEDRRPNRKDEGVRRPMFPLIRFQI